MFDTLIKNGTIIDGDKTPRYRADVAINGDQVVQIGDFSDADARQVIDATGKMIAPGFVDTHNHSDGWLLKVPYLVSKTTQGFTSEVIMADGISYAPLAPHTAHDWIYYMRTLNAITFEEYTGWQTLAEYMALLDGTNVQNSITHIPYANVRTLAFGGTGGWGQLPPDDYQMSLILREMEMGMEAGAVGVSTGLDYVAQFFATTDELVEACAPLVEKQGLYVTHVRYKKGTLAGVQEAVEIGKRAGIPVHISHFKGTTPQEVDELLTYVDTVATQEVDFSFDVYPYLPGSTMLNYLLPYEVWTDGPLGVIRHLKRPDIRQQFTHSLQQLPLDATHIAWVGGKDNHHHQGKMLSTYIAERGMSAGDAMADLLIEENLAVLLVISKGAEHDTIVDSFLAHDCYMMGSDGIYHPDSVIHPRQYGSTARILGPCVRDRGVFSLEEAVYKLSGYPAQRFGLVKRGIIREGWYADLVMFDADTIQDQATYTDPNQYSTGIDHVWVNGVMIIEDGKVVDLSSHEKLPGRALKFKSD